MLALDQLTVDIQNSRILRGISLQVAAGQLVCLIGRNGAGKTTTFRTIMGYLTPVVGTVVLNEHVDRRIADAQDRTARHRLCA